MNDFDLTTKLGKLTRAQLNHLDLGLVHNFGVSLQRMRDHLGTFILGIPPEGDRTKPFTNDQTVGDIWNWAASGDIPSLPSRPSVQSPRQPRAVTAHQGFPDATQFIQIWALHDRVNSHGVPAHYALDYEEEAHLPVKTRPVLRQRQHIQLQVGTACQVGMNGVTLPALLAIAIDQLEQHQLTPNRCRDNDKALAHLKHARTILCARAIKRAQASKTSRQAAKEPRK